MSPYSQGVKCNAKLCRQLFSLVYLGSFVLSIIFQNEPAIFRSKVIHALLETVEFQLDALAVSFRRQRWYRSAPQVFHVDFIGYTEKIAGRITVV